MTAKGKVDRATARRKLDSLTKRLGKAFEVAVTSMMANHHPFDHDLVSAERACPKCQFIKRAKKLMAEFRWASFYAEKRNPPAHPKPKPRTRKR